ncbi:HD domain-containing protein [Aerococcus viridans]
MTEQEHYFWEDNQEYMQIIADIKDHPFVTDLAYFKQHVHGNRLTHSYLVSYMAYKVARSLGWDYKACARAGLLHDLFYYVPGEVTFSKGSHLRNHPKIALMNALVVTDLSSVEEDIILKHMWLATPHFPRYKESYLVTFVDKYIATEDFVKPSLANLSQRQIMKSFRNFVGKLVIPALAGTSSKDVCLEEKEELVETQEEIDQDGNHH